MDIISKNLLIMNKAKYINIERISILNYYNFLFHRKFLEQD